MNRIRAIREELAARVPAAFTLVALSRRVGVSDKTLRSWEQGASQPTARHARALARELGVTVADLQLGEEPASSDVKVDRAAARREWARRSTASPPPSQAPQSGGRSSRRTGP